MTTATAIRRMSRNYRNPEAPVDYEAEEEKEDTPPAPKFLEMRMKTEHTSVTVDCEAIATTGYQICLFSACGPASTVKAIAAGLRIAEGVRFYADYKDYNEEFIHGGYKLQEMNDGLNPGSYGWEIHKHYLGLNTWHILAWSKWGRLLVSDDDEALWQMLRSDQFTTPILRSWIPAVKAELIKAKQLEQLRCFGCNCWFLSAGDHTLDKIVTAGVQSGDLRFE